MEVRQSLFQLGGVAEMLTCAAQSHAAAASVRVLARFGEFSGALCL